MSQVDWDRISKLANDISKITDEEVDITIDILSKIEDVEEIKDVDKLQKALEVSLTVLAIKDDENKQNIKYLDDANEDVKRFKEIKKELEDENAELQRGRGDIKEVRERLNYDMELQQKEEELNMLKKDYNQVKNDNDSKSVQITDLERDVERLQDENKKLADNVDFLRGRNNELKVQKDQSQDVKKSDFALVRSELRQKKLDLDNAMEEIEKRNIEIERLKESLQEATNEIETLTEEYKKIKYNYGSNDINLQNKESEIKMLQTKLEHLEEQLTDKKEVDDQIMDHLNKEVEKWKKMLAEKDAEIIKLYHDNEKLRRESQASNVNAEKANVQALIKLVKERDEEIAQLSEKVTEYTLEMGKNADEIENLKKDLDKTGGGTSGHQMRRIKELRQMLDEKTDMLKDVQRRLDDVERQSEEKEEMMNEVFEKNKLLESGKYGLAEAVSEIRTVKAEILVKERQVENLCQEVNKVNYAVEELKLENGHLRSKLGIPLNEVLDVDGYKRQKAAEEEQEKAMNLVLQKEIENLENERLTLKKKVRILAKVAGSRAGSAGIPVDDTLDELKFVDMEEEFVKTKTMPVYAAQGDEPLRMTDRTWKIKEKETNKELKRLIKEVESKNNEIAKLTVNNQELEEFKEGFMESINVIREDINNINSEGSDRRIEVPALDRFVTAMETKKLVVGNYDPLIMKAKLDHKEGQNEELRSQLKNVRLSHEELRSKYEKIVEQRDRLMKEVRAVSGMDFIVESESENVDSMTSLVVDKSVLPSGNVNQKQSQTVAALNHQLLVVMYEKDLQEKSVTKANQALESLHRKFAVVRHQQGLIYKQYAEEKDKFEQEIKSLQNKITEIQGKRSEDGVRLEEYQRLLETLKMSGDEVKQNIGDMSRDVTMCKVNENILNRKVQALMDMEHHLRRENNSLKNEMIQMEQVVTEKLGYYRRAKESNNFKIKLLQKDLDNSIPKLDMKKIQERLDEVTEKYRNMLEKQNLLVSTGRSVDQLEAEYNKLKLDHESVKRMLEGEKQKRLVLEASMEELMCEDNFNDGSSNKGNRKKSAKTVLNDAHLISLTKKMATLEVKELNERERADHYMRQYENLRINFDMTEGRNRDLEEKISLLTSNNLELQKVERELRNELEESVTPEVWQTLQNRFSEMEQQEITVRHEMEKLRETADIAVSQSAILLQQQTGREKESAAVRQQLLELEAAAGITGGGSNVDPDLVSERARLHRLVLQLQMSEAAALRKLEEAKAREIRLETRYKRSEIHMDEKEQTLYTMRLEARDRVRHMRDTINSLRSQFAGSIPLAKQERFATTLNRMSEEKLKLDRKFQELLQEKFKLETEVESCKIIEDGKKELENALADKLNEKSILVSWHAKMEQLRLDELKQRRQADLLSHQIEHLESVIKCQENQLAQVEEELVRAGRENNEREVDWEHRETVMEQKIGQLETMQGDVIDVAGTLHEAVGKDLIVGGMPDPDSPLPKQLEEAVGMIRKYVRLIYDKENTIRQLEKQNQELIKKGRDMEGKMLKQERYVTELRLRLPAAENRAQQMKSIFDKTEAMLGQSGDVYPNEEAVKTAQNVVVNLQERLNSKDEYISRLENLLKEAREGAMLNNQRHEEEMNRILSQLKDYSSRKVVVTSRPQHDTDVGGVLTKMREMEDLLTINKMDMERERSKNGDLKRENIKLSLELEALKKLEHPPSPSIPMANEEIERLQEKLNEKESQVIHLKQQKPEMVQEIKRLNNIVEDKNKLISELKKLVKELKDELVLTVKQKNQPTRVESGLENQIEDLRSQLLDYQKQLKVVRVDKENLQLQLDSYHVNQSDKDNQIRKLKSERMELEGELDNVKGQLRRIKNIRAHSTDRVKQELDELKLKLHIMEEENNQLKKDIINYKSKPKNTDSNIMGDLTKVKTKLSEKETDNNKLRKQFDTVSRALDRYKRENDMLRKRVTDKWGPGALVDLDKEEAIAPVTIEKAFRSPKKEKQKIENEIYDDVGDNKDSNIGLKIAYKETEMRNKLLQKDIEDLHRRLIHTGNASEIHIEKEGLMKNEIMRLNKENLALKIESESARKEIPRLKEKISGLEKYVQILKSEKEMNDDRSNRSMDSASTISSIRRIGESGKTVYELEKTIARLKKVIERTQKENERLKEAPGVVVQDKVEFLAAENEKLKEELDDLREQFGSRLVERHDSRDRGVARLAQDYEKVRRDLQKEIDNHQKTKQNSRQLEKEIDRLEKLNSDLERKLEIAETRNRQSIPRRGNELQDENMKLKRSVSQLRSELDQLHETSEVSDISDLKFALKKMTERNAMMEKQMRNVEQQFGISLNIGKR